MPSPRLRRTHHQSIDSHRTCRKTLLKLQPVPTTDGAPGLVAHCTCLAMPVQSALSFKCPVETAPRRQCPSTAGILVASSRRTSPAAHGFVHAKWIACVVAVAVRRVLVHDAGQRGHLAMQIMHAGSNAQSMPTQRVVGPCCSCSESRTTQRTLRLSVVHSNRQSSSAGPPAMPVTARSAPLRSVRAQRRPQHSPSSQIWTMTVT